MSVLTARLDKLAPALSARERAILALRRQSAGLEYDEELLRSMPSEQAREYNRYAGLVFVANTTLGDFCSVISIQVDDLEFLRGEVALLEMAAGLLEEEFPDEVKETPVRDWRKRGRVSVSQFLRGVALDMQTHLQAVLALRWKELRALEIVWSEVSQEFDGEDVVHPDLRQQANETREKLIALSKQAGRRVKTLPEPEAWIVDDARARVDQAFEALGLVKRMT